MLELNHISYAVREGDSELGILNDISLTIDDHRLVVFTGPNGGGKTTLAKIIMGLVKPTGGQIIWNGRDITDLGIAGPPGHQLRLPAAPPVQGADGPQPADHRLRGREAVQGPVLPVPDEGGPVRQRLPGPGGGRLPLRRRGEAHRDRHHPGPQQPADDLRRAGGGHDLWSFARLTETFEQIHAAGTATMIIISHQERIISLADEVIVVGDGELRHRGSPAEILPQILADTLGGCPVLTKEGAAV